MTFKEKRIMKNVRVLFLLLILLQLPLKADDKIKDKFYLSKGNLIESIHIGTIGSDKFIVLRFTKKLDSPSSKGRGDGEKSNYGDSSSTYCYKKESSLTDFEKDFLIYWFKEGKVLNVSYTCGELAEEDKRKYFPGFAETNCQCNDFTFDNINSNQIYWLKRK